MAKPIFAMKMEGFKELEKALQELPKSTSKAVLRATLRKASKPVVQTAQADAPVFRGDFKESIAIGSVLSKRQKRYAARIKGAVEMFIGAMWPKGAHGHLIEFGVPSRGIPPNPVLRRAWDSNKDGVLETFKKEIWAMIDKARARLARRALRGK